MPVCVRRPAAGRGEILYERKQIMEEKMGKGRIGVLGAGTWGMALARMLCLDGYEVTVWSALAREVEEYPRTRKHPNLPGMEIPEQIRFTADLEEACSGRMLILFAVPSVFVRQTAAAAAPFIPEGQLIADAAKGIEPGTHMTMTGIIADELAKAGKSARVAALSGPTHAEEVAKDMMTTIVSASEDPVTARLVQDVFMNRHMRVYTNTDVLGVELCGAMKNVIALAAGISTGAGNGDNAKAAIITRGIHEIGRLGTAMGCMEQTFSGLAGIGDLIVTATSVHSRNNRCGFLMGQGMAPQDAIREVGMVVEGINALPAAMELSAQYKVDMPLAQAVDQIVNHGAAPVEIGRMLMARDRKDELE